MSNMPKFSELNRYCEEEYSRIYPLYHCFTPENHPVIFFCSSDCNAFTCQLGICAKLNPKISLITYEIMSNHLHLIVSGDVSDIQIFLGNVIHLLTNYLKQLGRINPLEKFEFKYLSVTDLDYARNVIAYTHRNCYLANPDETPYTYTWGGNRFFFNKELVEMHRLHKKPLSITQIRELTRSRKYDTVKGLFMVNNLVSPLSFCNVEAGMKLFVNAGHYFSKISKTIEAYSEIAQSIGESVYCTDAEMYGIVSAIMKKEYDCTTPSMLTVDAKITLAKKMKFDYHATSKQIQRILKLDMSIVESLFGMH